MILLVCSCGTALRTSGEHAEMHYLLGEASDWYPDKYPCPRAGCTGYMQITDTLSSVSLAQLEVFDLTVQEAYSSIMGLGLPSERDCGEAALRELCGKSLASIDAVQIRGSNRSAVYSLLFKDGTRLFLGSGPEGAVAYRLAKPRSYTQEVLDEASGA